MTIQHKDIPDSQLHEVKGAASASAGQILVASGAGASGFRALVAADISNAGNIVTHNVSEFATASQGSLASSALQPSGNLAGLASLPTARSNLGLGSLSTLSNVNGYSQVLYSNSTATSQAPSAVDTALRVSFGSALSNSYVSLASDGLITFLQAGYYIVDLFLRYGRSTTSGQAILFTRLMVNGAQSLNSSAFSLPTNNMVIPFSASLPMLRAVNDTFSVEILRDSAGVNDGGLNALTPTLSTWRLAPTASVSIFKFMGPV